MSEKNAGSGKEKPHMLTLEERWQMDEEMQKGGVSNYQILTPQCKNCRFAKEDSVENCQKYEEIPWEIMTVQVSCPFYRKQKDQKPQIRYFMADDRSEILAYDFLPKEVLHRAQKFPVLAIWAYDGKEPVCGTLFTREADEDGVLVVLQYIYTLQNYRELGIASDLVKCAQKLFAESGTGRMAAFLDPEEAVLSHFFQAIGWEEAVCEQQILEYRPKSMISEQVKAFANGNMEGVFRLNMEVRRKILCEDSGMPSELKEYLKDSDISAGSLVYAPDRKVESAVILKKKRGYQMCICYLYVSAECQDKAILLRLLAAILGRRENWSGAGNVLIMEQDPKVTKLVEYLFGEPYRRRCRKKYISDRQT